MPPDRHGEPDQTLVIVGASLAGAKAAEGARTAGYDGRVVLVGAEDHLPYERPPLSKAVLRGEVPPESTRVHDPSYYAEHDIELLTGRTVEGLEAQGDTEHGEHGRHVRLDGGDRIPFTAAILATGAEPRRLNVPGADLGGIHYLRDIDGAARLADAIRRAHRVAVIGAGWIGCEVAASARQMGADVALVDPTPVPLQRVLGDEVGAVFGRLHADNGVELRLETGVVELRGHHTVEEVVLSGGGTEAADLVVVGIGVTPRVDLAAAAGLHVDNGVVVDVHLATGVPGIYAAGDVASAWHPRYERHLRVEHWSNALNQGLTAGANAAGGSESYERLPYFFSDQYDLGMEYVGASDPGDAVVVQGSLTDREFVAFWHRDGVVTAAMHANTWDAIDDMRAIVAEGRPLEELVGRG